ncbi:MAG: hypothetical protein WKF30_00155 [Pyrinomonadaceae bacterium]
MKESLMRVLTKGIWLLCSAALGLYFAASQAAFTPQAALAGAATAKKKEALASPKLPLDFVENRGQWNNKARFMARRGLMSASFERDAIELYESESENLS